MKKRTRQILNVVVILCLLASFSFAFASGDMALASPMQVMFSHINLLSTGLSINALGRCTCTALIDLTFETDTVNIYMYLQKWDGSYWSTIEAWTGTGSESVSVCEYYYVASGYDYRVLASYYVHDAGGAMVEQFSQPSYTVHY